MREGSSGGGVWQRPLLPLRFHLQPKDNFTYCSSENMIDITKDTCTYNQFNLDLIGVDVKSQRIVEVSNQLNTILKRLISSVKNVLL